jgi:molybdopterin-containing oxidoreductase family membrane subunit
MLKVNRLTDKSIETMEGKTGQNFRLLFAFFLLLFLQGAFSFSISIEYGLELWGINNNTVWGVTIANFVFWVGIAHAGTLISAILFLFKQEWRNAINRAAETMTLISIICAGLFLFIHTGRPWLSWLWMIPYPSQFDVWLNFKSPLFWDFIALVTYFTVSTIFWYIGLVPDLAFLKNRVRRKYKQKLYAFMSIGWIGNRKQWAEHAKLYSLIAGIATALVISVHSVVSMDFALTALPGWHSTIFPPYFVAGAIFSGSAMVVILLIILRSAFGMEEFIRLEHIEKLNKIVFFMSWIVFFAYIIEIFGVMFNSDPYEAELLKLKLKSPVFWMMAAFNCLIPQFLMMKAVRRNIKASLVIATLITIGMWLERILIVILSQKSGMIMSANIRYAPTIVEISIFAGSFGLFGLLYMIFVRILPIVPIWEIAKDEKQLGNHLSGEQLRASDKSAE